MFNKQPSFHPTFSKMNWRQTKTKYFSSFLQCKVSFDLSHYIWIKILSILTIIYTSNRNGPCYRIVYRKISNSDYLNGSSILVKRIFMRTIPTPIVFVFERKRKQTFFSASFSLITLVYSSHFSFYRRPPRELIIYFVLTILSTSTSNLS
jgi:hypothetical protein